MQETQEIWVQSLGGEDALEEGVVTHSSVLAWRIPWTEDPGGLQSTGWQRVGSMEALSAFARMNSLWGLPRWSVAKNPPANAGSIPGSGRSP